MPSLKQLNDKSMPAIPEKERSGLGVIFFLLVVFGIFGFGWFKYHEQSNVYTIPEKIYNSKGNSVFNRVVDTKKKQIFWISKNDHESIQEKSNMVYSLKYEKLDKIYDAQFLTNGAYFLKCPEKDCLDGYIEDLCGDVICIYVPSKHQIIKTDKEHLYNDLHKYKDL